MNNFPPGAVARLYSNLPPHLMHHRVILAFAARPRDPSLEWRHGGLHSIMKYRGLAPVCWSPVNIVGEALSKGGSAWLVFDCIADAHATIKTLSESTKFQILEQ